MRMFSSPIDKPYLISRLQVGIKHFEIKLPLLLYMRSIATLRDTISNLLINFFTLEKAYLLVVSMSKILNLDSYIIIKSYHLCYEYELQLKMDKTRNLITVVIHDINNPLQVVTGNISLLKKRFINKPQEVFINSIDQSAWQMDAIINNVRDATILEDNDKKIKYEKITISEIWREIISLFAGVSESLLADLFDSSKENQSKGTAGELGTGFGMSLTKHFVEKMGGQIKINSRCINEFPENHGTEIILSFPKFECGNIQKQWLIAV